MTEAEVNQLVARAMRARMAGRQAEARDLEARRSHLEAEIRRAKARRAQEEAQQAAAAAAADAAEAAAAAAAAAAAGGGGAQREGREVFMGNLPAQVDRAALLELVQQARYLHYISTISPLYLPYISPIVRCSSSHSRHSGGAIVVVVSSVEPKEGEL